MNTKHNQHVIDSLNHECDKRIKELDSDSPHADYIFYSFQDFINEEKEVQVETLERASMSFWHTDETIRNNTRRYK